MNSCKKDRQNYIIGLLMQGISFREHIFQSFDVNVVKCQMTSSYDHCHLDIEYTRSVFGNVSLLQISISTYLVSIFRVEGRKKY